MSRVHTAKRRDEKVREGIGGGRGRCPHRQGRPSCAQAAFREEGCEGGNFCGTWVPQLQGRSECGQGRDTSGRRKGVFYYIIPLMD